MISDFLPILNTILAKLNQLLVYLCDYVHNIKVMLRFDKNITVYPIFETFNNDAYNS